MQTNLNPTNVVVWTRKAGCPWCERAKALLRSKNIAFSEKVAGILPMDEFYAETKGAKTVPQILFDGVLIGGFDDLQRVLTGDNAKTTKVV